MAKILYHYCSNEAFLSIITNKNIRLSDVTQSNDHQEGKWLLDIYRKYFSAHELLKEYSEELVDDLIFFSELRGAFTFCMSEEGDLLSQWRGYANDGFGFCIGFAANKWKDAVDLFEVEYDEDQALVRFFSLVEEERLLSNAEYAYSEIFEGSLTTPFSDDEISRKKQQAQDAQYKLYESFSKMGLDLFKVKNPAFREEKEWRLVNIVSEETSTDSSKYTQNEGIFVHATHEALKPYTEVPFEPHFVKEVVLGPKNKTKEIVLRHLLDTNGYEHVKIKRSKASYR